MCVSAEAAEGQSRGEGWKEQRKDQGLPMT